MDHVTGNLGAKRARDELVMLLRAVSRSDRDAFSKLYARTAPKLYGICLRLTGNAGEAEDVLQETYVTVWRNAARFDPAKASPITWLAVLARNKAIDKLRRKMVTADDLGAAEQVADEQPSPFAVTAEQQDSSRLQQCLEALDARAAAMIRSAFLDGATYLELAEREGVPLGTMKSWIRRGLQRLRGCLEQ